MARVVLRVLLGVLFDQLLLPGRPETVFQEVVSFETVLSQDDHCALRVSHCCWVERRLIGKDSLGDVEIKLELCDEPLLVPEPDDQAIVGLTALVEAGMVSYKWSKNLQV